MATSNAIARSDAPFSLTDVVSQTRPPATTGDDHPRPGTGVFQTTFCDSLQAIGRPGLSRVALAGRPAELRPVVGVAGHAGPIRATSSESASERQSGGAALLRMSARGNRPYHLDAIFARPVDLVVLVHRRIAVRHDQLELVANRIRFAGVWYWIEPNSSEPAV